MKPQMVRLSLFPFHMHGLALCSSSSLPQILCSDWEVLCNFLSKSAALLSFDPSMNERAKHLQKNNEQKRIMTVNNSNFVAPLASAYPITSMLAPLASRADLLVFSSFPTVIFRAPSSTSLHQILCFRLGNVLHFLCKSAASLSSDPSMNERKKQLQKINQQKRIIMTVNNSLILF